MPKPMFTFEVEGDTQMARGFSRFADDIKDLRPAFKAIAKDFRGVEERQFETGGQGKWASLAPSTLAQKARMGYPSRILVRTGDMMDSLTGRGRNAIEEIRPLALVMGSRLDYPVYHQKGAGRMHRPVVDLTEDDKRSFMKTIQRYLVQRAKKRRL